jgi:3-dehydroquinate synthase
MTQILELKLDRKSAIIALGGGVTGDLSGFCAASYLRGISFIQVPTSLLAQVDSSVGGKVGINHPIGKNLIGAFKQPELVLIDPETLKTLPEAEFLSGMAEVIKYGLIRDQKLFELIKNNVEAIRSLDEALLNKIISRCCQIKAQVVQEDEKENSLRAILNFGHTFGHAFEKNTNYKKYRHGEAISAGMVYAGKLSRRMGMLGKEDYHKMVDLFRAFNLPIEVDQNPDETIVAMKSDKKVIGDKQKFILIKRIGQVIISEIVPPRTVLAALSESDASELDKIPDPEEEMDEKLPLAGLDDAIGSNDETGLLNVLENDAPLSEETAESNAETEATETNSEEETLSNDESSSENTSSDGDSD